MKMFRMSFLREHCLEKYGFSTVEEDLELANPIAEELNTLTLYGVSEFAECSKT